MKAYSDIFGNPWPKTHVAAATKLIVQSNNAAPSALAKRFVWGPVKASRVIGLLEDAGVVSQGTVILKNEDEAVNAALRQLKKGKK